MRCLSRRTTRFRCIERLLVLLMVAFASCAEPMKLDEQALGPRVSPSQESVTTDPTHAPTFELEKLDRGSIGLNDLRGSIVVIDFWAIWCAPCVRQIPELNSFFEAHREDGDVEVLGISIDTIGREAVEKWAREKDIRYPVLLGSFELLQEYLTLRGEAMALPFLVIIGPDGTIESSHTGFVERAELEAALIREREKRTELLGSQNRGV